MLGGGAVGHSWGVLGCREGGPGGLQQPLGGVGRGIPGCPLGGGLRVRVLGCAPCPARSLGGAAGLASAPPLPPHVQPACRSRGALWGGKMAALTAGRAAAKVRGGGQTGDGGGGSGMGDHSGMGVVGSESDWMGVLSRGAVVVVERGGQSGLGGHTALGSGLGGESLVWIGVGSIWGGSRVWAPGVKGPSGSRVEVVGGGPGCGGQDWMGGSGLREGEG